jgi:hypothetical protein
MEEQNQSENKGQNHHSVPRPVGQYSIIDDELIKVHDSVFLAARSIDRWSCDLIPFCRDEEILDGFRWRYYVEEIEGEIWKIVEFNEMDVEVSSHGRCKTYKGVVTYGSKEDKYRRVTLNYKKVYVHILICMAFHPKTDPNRKFVNHIDNDGDNNHFENLEWVTKKENSVHAQKFHVHSYKSIQTPIIKLDKETEEALEYFESITAAHIATKINLGNIGNVVKGNGRARSAGG